MLFNPESDHIVFSGSIVGVVNCTFDRMFVDVAVCIGMSCMYELYVRAMYTERAPMCVFT